MHEQARVSNHAARWMTMEPEAVQEAAIGYEVEESERRASSRAIFPFLKLPRELRDIIYNYTLAIEDDRSIRALRIERRNLKYFQPSAAAILLVLHHEYFLLNRQVAREALEALFKNHTVFLSCGPFVLKALLEKIEAQSGPGRQWLQWIKAIELDWVTFPNLTHYPPDRDGGRDEWYWEADDDEPGPETTDHTGHYDEHDHEGGHYDDNFYDPSNPELYPTFHPPPPAPHPPNTTNNPSGPAPPPTPLQHTSTKLTLLITNEVSPLFHHLAAHTPALTSITLPLYFLSRASHRLRTATRPAHTLPLKIRYWVHVAVHAFLMLLSTQSPLSVLAIRYRPWDIWATMDPADDLPRVAQQGVWFDGRDADEDAEREGEGEAFRAVWDELRARGFGGRMGLRARVRHVPWDGNVDSWRVGDELEVEFQREG
ncbi:hypothetical protein BDU57DRAFT_357827 [Ampelomyces quisqualis]|uniref:F-box domain-containing protein n=1 Tax=Ampelomyces quisqualis TaxID=50730 RepID=A0A6A5QCM9_AMPQU|nr:hypothetical protein BDU57DRAFT_357827 [Ampelomyces quisqualis]